MKVLDQQGLARRNEKVRRSWAKQAPRYDKQIGFFERRVFGRSHRPWACSRASGDVLETAIGTGLNLPLYPQQVRVTGLDLSAEMLEIARQRARDLQREVDLREGDAHDLPFPDESFDTVVCTYSLCNIPDPGRAVAEMKRVLRPRDSSSWLTTSVAHRNRSCGFRRRSSFSRDALRASTSLGGRWNTSRRQGATSLSESGWVWRA